MYVLFLLILISLFLGGSFLLLFIWSVKNGQMDDLESPSVRILIDDKVKAKPLKHPDNGITTI